MFFFAPFEASSRGGKDTEVLCEVVAPAESKMWIFKSFKM